MRTMDRSACGHWSGVPTGSWVQSQRRMHSASSPLPMNKSELASDGRTSLDSKIAPRNFLLVADATRLGVDLLVRQLRSPNISREPQTFGSHEQALLSLEVITPDALESVPPIEGRSFGNPHARQSIISCRSPSGRDDRDGCKRRGYAIRRCVEGDDCAIRARRHPCRSDKTSCARARDARKID